MRLTPGGVAQGRRPEGWPAALVVLGLGLAVLAGLFRTEGAAAVATWSSSTAYNHCWLVPPIAAWLAWQRRHRLALLAPRPSALLACLALPLGLAWLAAERLGIMEGRQMAALGLGYVLVLATLGWRATSAMAVPLAYLVFMVPFGEFAVPLLQKITAHLIEFGLGLTSIPHYVDALIIEIPAGTFFVAEACAGLRFSIAALAFGALYAAVMFRSPWRRLAVLGLAVVVPIIANGVRALGIVLLAHGLGSAEAAAADHVIYGWVFFSIVILLLVLAGLPFRQDSGPLPLGNPPPTARQPRHAVVLAAAALLAVLLAAAGPASALALSRNAGLPSQVPVRLTAPEGCVAAPDGLALRCPGVTVTGRLISFPPRVTWSAVGTARFNILGETSDEDLTFTVALPGAGGVWRARQPQARPDLVAVSAWLGGAPAGDGVTTRARQAWNSLRGGQGVPVLAALVLRPDGSEPPNPTRDRNILRATLEAQGAAGISGQAAQLSRGH